MESIVTTTIRQSNERSFEIKINLLHSTVVALAAAALLQATDATKLNQVTIFDLL
jgi:hypothetical protein